MIVQNVRSHHGHGGDNIFVAQITQSGLATPVLMLLFEAVFLLPLIAALVAGDIVAAEDGNGTLKTILTRSVDRGQVFAAKALAALTYAPSSCSCRRSSRRSPASPRGASTASRTYSGTVVSAPRSAAARVRRQRLLPDPAAAAVASIGVLLSTVTHNSAAAVVGHARRHARAR